MGKDDWRNIVVIEFGSFELFWFEEMSGKFVIGSNGYWGEFDMVGDVVKCVDVFDVGVLIFINYNMVFFGGFDVCCFKIEIIDGWCVVNGLD